MDVFNVTDNIYKKYYCDIGSDKACPLLYVLLSMITFITVGGNFLVIISISYFKQLHTPTNYLILSLSVADLLVGIAVIPSNITFTITFCSFVNTVHCRIRNGLDFTLSMSSILNLCCISIDRYYAVCQPLMYKTKVTDHVAGIMVAGTWGASVSLGIIYFILSFRYDQCELECFLILLLLGFFAFYIPIVVLFVVYFRILVVAQRQARCIENQTALSAPSASKKERKATKTMAIVMGVFMLCWLPLFIYFPFNQLDYITLMLFEPFNWFALCNSMFNPFIYAFFYRWFRAAFQMILTGKIFQGDLAHTKLH